jgi:hypothetical protein
VLVLLCCCCQHRQAAAAGPCAAGAAIMNLPVCWAVWCDRFCCRRTCICLYAAVCALLLLLPSIIWLCAGLACVLLVLETVGSWKPHPCPAPSSNPLDSWSNI